MSSPEGIASALARLEEGQRGLGDKIDAQGRTFDQAEVYRRDEMARLYKLMGEDRVRGDNALTAVRTAAEREIAIERARIDDHEGRIGELESAAEVRAWRRNLRVSLSRPVAGLLLGGAGVAVGIGVTRFLG